MKRLLLAVIFACISFAMPSYAGNDSVCSITAVDNSNNAQPKTFPGILTAGSYAYTLKVSWSEFNMIKNLDSIYVSTPKSYRGAVTSLEVVGGVIIGYTTTAAPFVIVIAPR